MESDKLTADTQERRLRRLLPAHLPERQPDVVQQPSASRRNRETGLTKAACTRCQQRKSKCSGGRPKCTSCAARNLTCEYDTSLPNETHSQALKRKYEELRDSNAAYQELYELLQTRPEEDAAVIVQCIRSTSSPDAALRQFQDDDLRVQIKSEPETRLRSMFPFSKKIPSKLHHPENPYLCSSVYEGLLEDAAEQSQAIPDNFKGFESIYLESYNAAIVIDPVLDSVKPSEWTSVSSDDVLMRQLLELYFRNEYLSLTCFHKDYFLGDMAVGRYRFCSPLLVNAILASAAMTLNVLQDRHEHWNPERLGYKFMAEARRLWDLEVEAPQITTAQAGIVITICYTMSGMDKIGWSYTMQAIRIARNLGLFTASPGTGGETIRRARDFTAWALFNYQCLHCFLLCDAPLMVAPPAVPLPDPLTDPAWFGEVWMQYPAGRRLYSAHLGLQFKATAKLRIIMNQICVECFGAATLVHVAPDRIRKFVRQLKIWYNSLPQPLQAKHIVLPNHLMLHMSYQSVLASFRIALPSSGVDSRASRFTINDDVVAYARNNLETLIHIYHLRHGFEVADKLLTFFMGRLAFATLDKHKPDTSSQEAGDDSSLFLAANGLCEFSESFYLAHILLRRLKSEMSRRELQLVSPIRDLPPPHKAHETELAEVYSRWPTSPISITENAETQRLCNLVATGMSLYPDERGDDDADDSHPR